MKKGLTFNYIAIIKGADFSELMTKNLFAPRSTASQRGFAHWRVMGLN